MAERTRNQKNAMATEDRDLQHVMDSPQGRRFVWALLETCHIYHSSFTGGSDTFFREGERNIGLQVFNRINAVCPKQYGIMQAEHRALLKRNEQRKEKKGQNNG